ENPIPKDVQDTKDKEKQLAWLYEHIGNILQRYLVTFSVDDAKIDPKPRKIRQTIYLCHRANDGCDFVFTHEKTRDRHEQKMHGYKRKQKAKTVLMDIHSKDDHVLGYQKALFTLNMLLRNINDSVKEGDGERLLECYKVALLYFKTYNNTKYSFGLLKLFTDIKFHPERACNLIWNRFVNTKGYAGHNIAMDLHMEHLNGYLKESLRRLRSNLNEKTADKVAKAMNNVRKLINNTEESLESVAVRSSRSKPSSYDDVKKLAEEMLKANILSKTEGRSYESFRCFEENVLNDLDYDEMNDWVKGYEKKHKKNWVDSSEKSTT
uniref:DUF6589 domain-containing protein n=2 Tax=Clytia hemisphaerica TaxID=252671 RepID=A0A7M5X4V5_9CNID